MAYPQPGKVKESVKFSRFDSPEEYVSYLKGNLDVDCIKSRRDNFYGASYSDALDMLSRGAPQYVAKAQALISKMADENIFSLNQPVMEASLVGFLPNIGNYMAGQPNDMWNMVQSENENITTPLTIYVETLVSGGVSQQELEARGIAIMGFALAMNAIRPTEIFTICVGRPRGGNGGIICRIPSKPLDIERAAFMLCDPAYYRRLAFSAMCDHVKTYEAGYIQWPWAGSPTEPQYHSTMRELCDMQPEDVYIPGGYLFDQLMLKNPVQWVKNMIAKHRGDSCVSE